MSTFPALFVTHGAPSLPLTPGPARDFLAELGGQLGRPKSILLVSAHWETPEPMLSLAPLPATIHDFGGFPEALYRMRYPAPGAPALAERAAELLGAAGHAAHLHPTRGLDHGAWVPLMLMYPEADIPVTELSVQPARDAAAHWRIGEALRPLREEGVLILASGSATHNLREFGAYPLDSAPPDWVRAFDTWLTAAIVEGRRADLEAYRTRAPQAQRNHPTPEHLLPLFVAAGAGAEAQGGRVLHESYTYGILSMAAYAFA